MSSRSSDSNPAEALFPDDVCIHHLFAKQAMKHPEAVAVVFEDERITYRELNEKANQLACWKEKLSGPREYLNLPVHGSLPAVQRHDGSRYYFTLSHSLTDALNHLRRQEKVSLYMLLLATYQTLLHQYSGQDDIIAGSPIANRNHPQVEEIIGIFIIDPNPIQGE